MNASKTQFSDWFSQTPVPAALARADGSIQSFNKAFGDYFAHSLSSTDNPNLLFLAEPVSAESLGDLLRTNGQGNGSSLTLKIRGRKNHYFRLYPGNDESNSTYLIVVELLKDEDPEKLRLALEEAQEGSRMKTAFLANMSHEIRTPLNTIIGFSELILEEEMKNREMLDLVEMIKSSGKSLLQLIEDIIDISRIEAGQIRISKADVRIESVFRELLQMFDNEIYKRGKASKLELRIGRCQPSDACVHTDPYRFRQIMINLLSNAIKFTESGIIEFGYLPADSALMQFYVKDTGIGIDPAAAAKVFQRFGQIGHPGVQNRQGVGLGMSITRQLVELMGGQIWFDSQPGKGTTFYFTLPACNPQKIQTAQSFALDLFEWSNEIFLVVDDVEYNYLFLRSVLKNTGALLLWAKNGEEAVRYCRSNPDISLVLMDMQLPKLDGFEATRQIKEINPNLPVIAQTAFADDDSRRKAMESGCDDFLAKPINKQELFTVISQHLRK
ncbi:MAG: response regulator [Bacteroidetes bacterium]|nr:response regulator [Bacteroidota bacterium]